MPRSPSEIGCQKIALTDIEDIIVRSSVIPPAVGSVEVRMYVCVCVYVWYSMYGMYVWYVCMVCMFITMCSKLIKYTYVCIVMYCYVCVCMYVCMYVCIYDQQQNLSVCMYVCM